MPRKFKFCMQCRRTIVEDEFRRGLYVQMKQGMLCATCAQRMDEETEAAKQAAEAAQQAAEAAKAAEVIAQAPVAVEPPAPVVEEKPKPVSPPSTPPEPKARKKSKPVSPPEPPIAAPEPTPQPHAKEVAVPQAVIPDLVLQEIAAKPPTRPTDAAADLLPATPKSHPELSVQMLEGIREHVEAIRRTLVFEKSSPWNVLAAVAQCLAVGMLIIAAVNWADDPMHLLLVALIFQVMALTFFVRGK